ncbi:MAG TPA: hypothetical protein VJQ43_02955 [Thermoplasmata archaeon]|nr:hypothetical protein [Thermoplasmata archaeon]
MSAHPKSAPSPADSVLASLRAGVDASVSGEPLEPWCVHRLAETLQDPTGNEAEREQQLMVTQLAADQLAAEGKLKRASVNAIALGVHCEDVLYWSPKTGFDRVAEFGPDYEEMALLRRLGAHFRCHGL